MFRIVFLDQFERRLRDRQPQILRQHHEVRVQIGDDTDATFEQPPFLDGNSAQDRRGVRDTAGKRLGKSAG